MNSTPLSELKVGDEATTIYGSDRHPAKVSQIVYAKNGSVKGVYLQEYEFSIDFNTEGYAKEIMWDVPRGYPILYKVVTKGKRKGTIPNVFLGAANAFYDRSF